LYASSGFCTTGFFLFRYPETIDTASILPKWNEAKQLFFIELIRQLELMPQWQASDLENEFKEMALQPRSNRRSSVTVAYHAGRGKIWTGSI